MAAKASAHRHVDAGLATVNIPELPRHLKVKKQLGRGAYGTVYLCEDQSHGGQEVAVKHVRKAARQGKSMLREVRLLARLNHENLLHLLDFPAVSSPNFEDMFLVLPYFPADLHKVIQSKQALSDKHVQVISAQLLRALEHLHAAGVAHRDLKPANVLLNADCKLKVCDFGLARGDMCDVDGEEEGQECGVLTEYVVTRWYRAPEVMLLPKQYTVSLDLWALGCILGEMLGRKALFPGKNHVDMMTRISQVLGSPAEQELNWLPKTTDAYNFMRKVCPKSDGMSLAALYPSASRQCLDFLKQLLRWDPSGRPTAAEAQRHEWLYNFQPREPPIRPEPFDWSFDGFKGTPGAVRERLYFECARFHPEIKERDRAALVAAGLREPPPSPTPLAPQQLGQQGARSGGHHDPFVPEPRVVDCRDPTPTRRDPAPARRDATPPRQRDLAAPRRDATPQRRTAPPPRRDASSRSVTPQRRGSQQSRQGPAAQQLGATALRRGATPPRCDQVGARAASSAAAAPRPRASSVIASASGRVSQPAEALKTAVPNRWTRDAADAAPAAAARAASARRTFAALPVPVKT